MRILIIEDDKQIGGFLKQGLEAECFAVDWVEDGEKGLTMAKVNDYDLIILDNVLPSKNGPQICQEIRKAKKTVPILITSIVDDVNSKVDLLNFGADDYIIKPFSFEELKARVRALLRRPRKIESDIVKIGDIVIDTQKNKVTKGEKEILLTRKELMLLEYFIRNEGKVLSRSDIAEHVWDMNFDPFSNTIESHILGIRKKLRLKGGKVLIRTITGRGYKMEQKC